jgi:hypothetical protein
MWAVEWFTFEPYWTANSLSASAVFLSLKRRHACMSVRCARAHRISLNALFGVAGVRRVRIELAAALARVTPGMLQQTIFASSGSEAVEAAIKTAIMATGRTSVLAFEGGACRLRCRRHTLHRLVAARACGGCWA